MFDETTTGESQDRLRKEARRIVKLEAQLGQDLVRRLSEGNGHEVIEVPGGENGRGGIGYLEKTFDHYSVGINGGLLVQGYGPGKVEFEFFADPIPGAPSADRSKLERLCAMAHVATPFLLTLGIHMDNQTFDLARQIAEVYGSDPRAGILPYSQLSTHFLFGVDGSSGKIANYPRKKRPDYDPNQNGDQDDSSQDLKPLPVLEREIEVVGLTLSNLSKLVQERSNRVRLGSAV